MPFASGSRGRARRCFELLAQPVEDAVPAGFLLIALAGEPISKLTNITRKQLANTDRTGCL
jgi:hypothetical protein